MSYLTSDSIDPTGWRREAADPGAGAAVEFLGLVRGDEAGRPITHLLYDAYAPMAERTIARLVNEAQRRWPLRRVVVRHRVGRVDVGQIAVLVGVQAPHREEAFEACRFLIDAIKQDAPIWKRAIGADGAVIEASCAAHARGGS